MSTAQAQEAEGGSYWSPGDPENRLLGKKVVWSPDNREFFLPWSLTLFCVLSCLPTPSQKELAE